MKPLVLIFKTLVAVLLVASLGCKERIAEVDATEPLKQSFEKAAPEVKQAIQAVNVNLRAGNYAEATRVMSPAIHGQQLTDAQKEAVALALKQINQAVAANPNLDNAELYRQRQQMFNQVYRGSRF